MEISSAFLVAAVLVEIFVLFVIGVKMTVQYHAFDKITGS